MFYEHISQVTYIKNVTCMLNERKDMCDRHRTLQFFTMET